MVKTLAGALALAVLPSALAFRNTSPFLLFSTSDLNIPNTDASIAESSQVTSDILGALKGCPTKSYVIVEQAGVSSTDFVDGRSAPQLSRYMSGKEEAVKTTFAIPEVLGEVDARAISSYLKVNCGATALSMKQMAPVANKAHRMQSLQASDDTLEELINSKVESNDYTVMYITSPPSDEIAKVQLQEEHPPYEMEDSFGDSTRMELKRDTSSYETAANSTSSAGLFEKYQYFTPGLFMGFAAIIPLFLILLVGIRALTSLEVSYFAFSKEMGPNAQKKQ